MWSVVTFHSYDLIVHLYLKNSSMNEESLGSVHFHSKIKD